MRVRELSVFLPCYEEEGNVARTVERAVAALRAELTRAGATKDEIARVVARIKSVSNAR